MDESIERLQAALADVKHDLKIATKNKQMFKSNEDGFADHNYKASIWEGIYLELKFRKAELQFSIKKLMEEEKCSEEN